MLALNTALTQTNHTVFGKVILATGADDCQITPNTWLNKLHRISLHLRESEEAKLEEDTAWHKFRTCVDRCLEDNEFEGDCAGTKLVHRLHIKAQLILLAILATHLSCRVPEQITIAHLH